MPFRQIIPIIDYNVRLLCWSPYYNHPAGCPNYNHRKSCPPQCPPIDTVFDTSLPCWVIWNRFDFAEHCKKMKRKHPNWTQRQIECCLYWQSTARKQLAVEVEKFLQIHYGFIVIRNPEAMGVCVTTTMKKIGIKLEWPPQKYAYQVALANAGRQETNR